MKNISIEDIEQKIEAGEEVIDRYFDSATTRVGARHQMTSRRRQDLETTNLEVPSHILNELDKMAKELNISRQAVITIFINKFRGFKPCGRGQIKNLSSLQHSCPLPSAFLR